MTRRCSHCSHDGHNSRTCPDRGLMLFGVRLTGGTIRKSASMGNLPLASGSIRKSASMGNLLLASGSGGGGASPPDGHEPAAAADGYASEDLGQGPSSSARERKKGTPWTEEEHRRRKRRSSLFDMVPDEPVEPQSIPVNCQETETQNKNLHQVAPVLDEECKPVEDANNNKVAGEAKEQQPEIAHCSYPLPLPAYFPPFVPFSFCVWPGYGAYSSERQAYEIIRPTAIHTKNPIKVDDIVGMSKLSLKEHLGETASAPLTLDLLGGSNRQSAFHSNPPTRAHS
ncbi:hypothetical protein OPV22_029032 [Ensete ventricosum]|uniref:CCHC-type domain-containing protein n=1 Tax=Ensete ventricosum TaxID=4639 RepID=A0AAV8Q4J1_ENSVE|nr:hypothetical protein OPV22_029032 [Ensete ventricosum]